MKILKIENNIGYFINNGEWKNISLISKDDVLKIMNLIFESNETIEMDKEDDSKNKIHNKAEAIIYARMREYLENFVSEKSSISEEVDKNLIKILNKND